MIKSIKISKDGDDYVEVELFGDSIALTPNNDVQMSIDVNIEELNKAIDFLKKEGK